MALSPAAGLRCRILHLVAPLMAAAAGVVLTEGQAVAAGDVDAGRKLAQTWCTSCHLAGNQAQTTDGPPTLRTIARTRTPAAIATRLAQPHRPMPDLSLSRAEIDNLTAYIGSLEPR